MPDKEAEPGILADVSLRIAVPIPVQARSGWILARGNFAKPEIRTSPLNADLTAKRAPRAVLDAAARTAT